MPPRKPCPKGKGQCRTCWNHAYDPDIHRGQHGDCPVCVDHMVNGHPPGDIEP
jgi:hypothetical protein